MKTLLVISFTILLGISISESLPVNNTAAVTELTSTTGLLPSSSETSLPETSTTSDAPVMISDVVEEIVLVPEDEAMLEDDDSVADLPLDEDDDENMEVAEALVFRPLFRYKKQQRQRAAAAARRRSYRNRLRRRPYEPYYRPYYYYYKKPYYY